MICIYIESFQKGEYRLNCEFEKYILQYSSDLTRLCLSLCGNKSEAEELFQDTWLKALRFYPKYDKTKPFDKWLFSICVNTYKNIVQSAFIIRRKSFSSDEEKDAFFNSISEINDDNKHEYLELHEAISKLSKKQRVVIVLYYFKDYSIAEISQIINIPEGTVKSRLANARAEIKRRLTNE